MRNSPLAPSPEPITPAAPALPLASSLFFKLVRVVNMTARPFQAGLGHAHQLTLNEWRVMVVLASHPGSAATDIAEATGLDKMSVSRALAGLGRRDRVLLKSDSGDLRRSRVYLTAAAKTLFAQIGRQAMQREADVFSGISARELKSMGQTLDKLVLALKLAETK